MGFRIKIAPGVRISVGRHHVRTHIGPRIARVHVGSGRPGVSTGIGPLTVFGGIGTPRRSHRPSSSRGSGAARTARSSASNNRVGAARTTSPPSSSSRSSGSHTGLARKKDRPREAVEHFQEQETPEMLEARATRQVFVDIETLLQQSFKPAEKPVISVPDAIDEAEIRKRRKREALNGLGILRLAERFRAKAQANRAAQTEIEECSRKRELERIQAQSELDDFWQLLCDNEPDVVLDVLIAAFGDKEPRAAAISVNGSEVDLVVLVPGVEFIPDRMPEIAAFGITESVVTKTGRSAYYKMMVCGRLLNTVRQALAVAPAITGVTAAAVRFADSDTNGTPRLECVLAAHFTRESVAEVEWEQARANHIVHAIATDFRMRQAGPTGELQPLLLSEEPDLERLLEQLDISELATPCDPATPAASAKTLDTSGRTVPANQATPAASAKTLGALLDEAEQRGSLGSPLLIHLAPGSEGIAKGRAFAEMVAATIDKPLRVITAGDTRSEGAVCLLQRLVPGQVVYLERVEEFSTDLLPFMLAALCDRLVLLPSDEIRLVEFDGQYLLRAQLEIVLEAARQRGQPADHVLLVGPPGFDKAELADFVARVMGAALRTISGRELVQSGDVAAILTDLDPGDVLFIDQIHRVGPKVEALLYKAMEDFQLDIVLGRGGTARSTRLDLPKFTIVGATTNLGALSAPLRNRFGLQLTAETYSPDRLSHLVRQIWDKAGLSYEDDAANLVAERSMGVPWRAYIFASLVVRSQTSSDDLGSPLTARFLYEILEEYAFDDKGFTETDWWLQNLRFGNGKYIYGPHGSLPRVSTIVSTSVPWKADSDVRYAFASLAEALPYRLVMPRLHSRDVIRLRREAKDIPLIA